ncbi:MAG: hypothetical protein EOP45_06770 [Sphingobacteriaceae bacterium]|nr:MAG: hypothetical protein EOP45_06770 [Sphingobacteriaceae bacterium]
MNTPLKATQDAVSMLRKPGTKAQPSHESPAARSQTEKKIYVPFSSRITSENQLALDQIAYWSREAKVDILNAALEAYFMTRADSNNPIPIK